MKTLIVGVILIIFESGLMSQTPSDAAKSLVDAENAFAAMAGQKGIKASFLATMAKDAIVFSPEPTDARKHYEAEKEDPGLLYWVPEFVQVSGAGDLGWTMGPWEYRAHRTDEKPLVTGHFVTVWKKQADGTWRWVLDAGVPHALKGDVKSVKAKAKVYDAPKAGPDTVESALKSLAAMDAAFSQGARKTWCDLAYASGKDLCIYRKGSGLIRPEDKEFAAQSALPGEVIFTPYDGGVSESAAMGYTYGLGLYNPTKDKATLEEFSYLHIWEVRKDGSWKIVVDLTNPIPPKK